MSSRRLVFVANAMLLLSIAVARSRAAAQSPNPNGARDGLVLSPVGALAPMARAPVTAGASRDEIEIRYGRWRYDPDDAIHDNIGLTWTHRLNFARSRLSLTGAYSLVECPTCSAWASGAVELESTLWEYGDAAEAPRPFRSAVSLRMNVGGAHYLGPEPSTAGSSAIVLPMTFGVALGRWSTLRASIEPGFGYGHVTGEDFASGGFLPMIGGAGSLTAGPRVAVNFGVQRVMLAGAPTVVGAGLSWKLR
jgi:hypothetical protein